MTNNAIRRVVIPNLDLSLTGVSAAEARAVADALPGAINRAMAQNTAAQNVPLTQTDRRPAAIASRLATEIAGQIRAGLRRDGGAF
jgi:hypothetical protein